MKFTKVEAYEQCDHITTDSITQYLNDIKNYEILTEEEEKELIRLAKKGNKKAKEELFNCNAKLVIHLVKKRKIRSPLEFPDLIQLGNEGLLKAIEKIELYDPKKARFTTFASWWINALIKRAEENLARTIRLPSYLVQIKTQIRKTEEKYENLYNRKPTIEEIKQEHPKLSYKNIEYGLKDYNVFSVNNTYEYDNKETDFTEFLPSVDDTEGEAVKKITNEKIREAIEELPEIEKKILVFKYFENMKDFEILDILKISRRELVKNEKKAKNNFKDKITQFIF